MTAATLRAAHGNARCGRCGHKFDVLEHLTDELPPRSAAARPAPAAAEELAEAAKPETVSQPAKPATAEAPAQVVISPAPSAAPPSLTTGSLADAEADLISVANAELTSVVEGLGPEDYHFSAEDIEKVFIDARDWQKQYGGKPTPGSDEPVADLESEPAKFEIEEPERVEDITLEGFMADIESDTGESLHLEAEFEYLEDEEYDLDSTSRLRTLEDVSESVYPDGEEDESPVHRAPVATPPAAAATHAGAAAATRAARPAEEPMRADLRTSAAERWSEAHRRREPDDLSELDLGRTVPPRTARSSQLLAIGSVLLAIALGVQLAHYYRQDIVRHPQAGPALRRAYAALGQPLSPNWDLDAFEVRQWGPTADVAPGESLTVRASLTNRAEHAQPYPLLRLEFEDRFGEAVARRDFAPAEYLKSPPQALRQMNAGESTEAELSVIAPGADAVGYRLDVCLREDTGPVRCAHGQGAAP